MVRKKLLCGGLPPPPLPPDQAGTPLPAVGVVFGNGFEGGSVRNSFGVSSSQAGGVGGFAGRSCVVEQAPSAIEIATASGRDKGFIADDLLDDGAGLGDAAFALGGQIGGEGVGGGLAALDLLGVGHGLGVQLGGLMIATQTPAGGRREGQGGEKAEEDPGIQD